VERESRREEQREGKNGELAENYENNWNEWEFIYENSLRNSWNLCNYQLVGQSGKKKMMVMFLLDGFAQSLPVRTATASWLRSSEWRAALWSGAAMLRCAALRCGGRSSSQRQHRKWRRGRDHAI
jgi:hypothetical protein